MQNIPVACDMLQKEKDAVPARQARQPDLGRDRRVNEVASPAAAARRRHDGQRRADRYGPRGRRKAKWLAMVDAK